MDDATRQRLLDLNRRFYDAGAARFSATRRRPWAGWRELLPQLRAGQGPGAPWRSACDVGCGNGRFAAFLAAEGLLPAAYLGIDGSAGLLADARALELPGCEFLEADLARLPAALPGEPFDRIAIFGVLHHLPGRAARRSWLEQQAARLAPGGLLFLSFWLLDRFPERFAKLRRSDPGFDSALEAGDALLSFDGNAGLPRYCHFPDDAEIAELCALPGCAELRRFREDGPSGADNLYAVLQRQPQPQRREDR
jgi:SAM-dependent methyltransferase